MNDQELLLNALAWRRMRHLYRYLRREEDDSFPHGLGEVSAAVLALLWQTTDWGRPLNQRQIALLLRSSEQSISNILKKVETAGFCEPDIRFSSLRGKFHRITPKGQNALSDWIQWEYAPDIVVDAERAPQSVQEMTKDFKQELDALIRGYLQRAGFVVPSKENDPGRAAS